MRDLAVEAARGKIRIRPAFRDGRPTRRRRLAPDRVADRMLRAQRGASERLVDRHGSVDVRGPASCCFVDADRLKATSCFSSVVFKFVPDGGY